MLSRRVAAIIGFQVRNLSKKLNYINKPTMKQVHEELLLHIDPQPKINICADIQVIVRVADVHAYPNGDVFIAELHGGHVKNCGSAMNIKVSEDEKEVDVKLTKLTEDTDFHCELMVPVRSSLNIKSKANCILSNLHSDDICVDAEKNIKTTDIRATNITFNSKNGDVNCAGLLLGNETNIATEGNGEITLNKPLGNMLKCRTISGNITTNSCYSNSSFFETDFGRLKLKNVHKQSKVVVHKNGRLEMTGVHGNINLHINGGDINLQLTEIHGESNVYNVANTESIINVSDEVEANTHIAVKSALIVLDPSLSHLNSCLCPESKKFSLKREDTNPNQLNVWSKGCVKLGKKSWTEITTTLFNVSKK
ncbi:uncharacterized protein LOC119680165 [Teleopsis dalmanni]|uniref:uncharacterized protein LOC119680165 n=1 Tax=Teleopsis dalmanni TaxID=139649 RepID=UPI0018CDEFD5|nr:uncharacterized protein LOC119680165 [Teleopsis dalmanni]